MVKSDQLNGGPQQKLLFGEDKKPKSVSKISDFVENFQTGKENPWYQKHWRNIWFLVTEEYYKDLGGK